MDAKSSIWIGENMQEISQIVKYFDGTLTENEVREEQVMLSMQLDAAGEEIKGAAQLITRAVIRLEDIRASGRFRFGYRTWNECLQSFIEERGIGSSSMKKWLKIIRIWKAIGREPEKLLEYGDGIQTIEPVLDGRYKLLNEYNQTNGEPVSLMSAWDEKLEGKTPKDKLNAFIDQIAPEATRQIMTHSMHQEAPANDKIDYQVIYKEDGTPIKMKWEIETPDHVYRTGFIDLKGIVDMPPVVFANYCRRLGAS